METMENIQIVFEDTPEKFQPLAEEILPPLLEVLKERNELEKEIFARSLKLRKEKAAAGVPEYQSGPEEEALWEEYGRRYLDLVSPHCTEKMLKWGAARSFGKPAKYDYLLDAPEFAVHFTMKSAKRAVVTARNSVSYSYGYRFILRPFEDGWKVDGAECALGDGGSWGVEHSL